MELVLWYLRKNRKVRIVDQYKSTACAPLKLAIHLLNLLLHVRNLLLTRLNLLLQLLDLVVKHKLELFKLLVLLLEVIDASLLVADGLVSFANFPLQTRNVLLQ